MLDVDNGGVFHYMRDLSMYLSPWMCAFFVFVYRDVCILCIRSLYLFMWICACAHARMNTYLFLVVAMCFISELIGIFLVIHVPIFHL